MDAYTEKDKEKDFQFFKDINKGFYSENGHKFLAIRNQEILDNADTVNDLIDRMNGKSLAVGNYLIQECTGDDSAFTNTVMRLMIRG